MTLRVGFVSANAGDGCDRTTAGDRLYPCDATIPMHEATTSRAHTHGIKGHKICECRSARDAWIDALTRTSSWSKEPGAVSRQCADKASIHQGGTWQHARILNGRGGMIAKAARDSAVYVSFAQLNCQHLSTPLLQENIRVREQLLGDKDWSARQAMDATFGDQDARRRKSATARSVPNTTSALFRRPIKEPSVFTLFTSQATWNSAAILRLLVCLGQAKQI